jgi:hypothetical protein
MSRERQRCHRQQRSAGQQQGRDVEANARAHAGAASGVGRSSNSGNLCSIQGGALMRRTRAQARTRQRRDRRLVPR